MYCKDEQIVRKKYSYGFLVTFCRIEFKQIHPTNRNDAC